MIKCDDLIEKFASVEKGTLLTKTEHTSLIADIAAGIATAEAFADTAETNANIYTDQKIAGAVTGDEIGFFHIGRSATATPLPAPSSAGDKAFDFETNTPYRSIDDGAGDFIWEALPPLTPQESAKIDVMEMLDGTGVDGGDLTGKGATGLFVSGAWQFVEQSGVLGAPPNDGKIYAMCNGAWVEILVDY